MVCMGSKRLHSKPPFPQLLLTMKTKLHWLPAFLALASLAAFSAPLRAGDAPQYKLLKEIPVGGDGGWDMLSVDEGARRLYASHGTVVVVIDIDKDAVAGQIEDTQGVHGFAIAPELQLGFSSNGRENKVSIVDLKTLKTTSKVDTGENPDEIIYEPGNQEVYAFNGRGHSATIIDAKAGKVTATIDLPGKPEFAAADPGRAASIATWRTRAKSSPSTPRHTRS